MKQNNRYVFKSRRLKEYNYDLPGAYFITVCVKDHKCIFGDIVNGKMILNELGKIADESIIGIPNHFDNTEIPIHVIMPNHVHAIVNIYEGDFKIPVGGRYICHLPEIHPSKRRQDQKIPVIIGTYKAAVTREINKLCPSSGFKWQRYYHDHIISTERAMENIYNYIKYNPESWDKDLENKMYMNNISVQERTKRLKEFYKELKK